MDYPIRYPDIPGLAADSGRGDRPPQWEPLLEYARLKCEYGVDVAAVERVMAGVMAALDGAIKELDALPQDAALAAREPDGLDAIRALRPAGPRKLWTSFDRAKYADRQKAAMLGRFAACVLGAAVEFWSIEKMEVWARYNGDNFPPTDYWKATPYPEGVHYGVSPTENFTKPGLNGAPADDDIIYTLLGLLIMEDYGRDFTTGDVGKAWVKYLSMACTAEKVALENLQNGVPAEKAAEQGNPYVQWIGADIRSDPWGYLAPGWPEMAAEFAWRDARISHRRNGVYGEMYFSAVIAAAFAVGDYKEALRVGLTEIPERCLLADALRWALDAAPDIKDYRQARAAVEAHFGPMNGVHTILNACLVVFALYIGDGDFTKTAGECVAMGYDNDCTAATAGSILGACYGMKALPERWYAPFGDKVTTYLNGHREMSLGDVITRFFIQAEKTFASRG